MRRLLLSIFALSVLPASALLAQNITGTWQGALKVNGPNGSVDLRTVIKISRADNDSLAALFYSIDQDPTPLSATSITLKGSALKISITALSSVFEGTLGGDGNTISGKWTQGANALPLNLVRSTDQTAWTIPERPPPPAVMPANAKPEFTVATIKPSRPDAPRGGYGFRGRDVTTTNVTVNWLIKLAYNMHARQISGGPAWLDSEKYDIVGRPDTPGQPSRDQMKVMIQKLLADRFQLKFHTEKRELPVYAMVLLKTGAKITVSAGDPHAFPGIGFVQGPGVLSLIGRNTGLDGVANGLQSNILDKPVVNQTGLTGRYDFTLRFTPDLTQVANFGPLAPGNAADLDAPPDIFTAFQQQLGLKLQSTKAAVDVMVIENIERPSPN
jgi:uncharacterized protein (TIGR03435 family)